MSEFLKAQPDSVYTLSNGFKITYDAARTLPPDEISEQMGKEAALAINRMRFGSDRAGMPINVLELGIGTGVILASTLANVKSRKDISVYGIDIDPYAVDLTRKTLNRLIDSPQEGLTIDLQQRDWLASDTWDDLRQRKYHIIHFNPPFLPPGENVRTGYEGVPKSTMYSDDPEGLDHYRYVLPQLPTLLSEDTGSAVIIRRRPPADGMDFYDRTFYQKDELTRLVEDLYAQMPGCSKSEQVDFDPARSGSWVTIGRSNGWGLPIHQNPLISAVQDPDADIGSLLKLIAPKGVFPNR